MATLVLPELKIGRGSNVALIEKELSDFREPLGNSGQASLRIVQEAGSSLFADLWIAIAVGTACRLFPQANLILRGLRADGLQQSPFWSSPAGFVGAQMAARISGEQDRIPVDLSQVLRQIATEGDGIGDYRLARSRTIVELDPDLPMAPVVAPPPGPPSYMRASRRRLIDRAILDFRLKLELGALKKKMIPQAEGLAGAVGGFLFELFDNAYQYGRPTAPKKSVRMLRMRKHIANSRKELIDRAIGLPSTQDYLVAALPATGTVALVEASVSDFGSGIVDAFLDSPVGKAYRETERSDLLDQLIHKRFGSRLADPASGEGIMNALKSISSMGGHASLRTGEFFAFVSCAAAEPRPRMTIETRPATVAGTHWQLLWSASL